MTLPRRAAAVGAILILLPASLAATHASDGAVVIAAAYGRNETLRAYTFHMNVKMAMHHFPWLHFSMQGDGQYDRSGKYCVHFTQMPGFAAGKVHDIDLTMIDPNMWPGRYRYYEIGEQDGDSIFALASANADDKSLANATVALNPASGARWVDVTYSDGTRIRMQVSSEFVRGYLLPQTIEADVDYPHMPLSAHAEFNGYDLATQPLHDAMPLP